jgi:hypothetical protein
MRQCFCFIVEDETVGLLDRFVDLGQSIRAGRDILPVDPCLEIIFPKSIMEDTRKGYVFTRVGDEDICHGIFLLRNHIDILRQWHRTSTPYC